MTQPLVSIGVPVFNGEKTLAACLNSLLAQTYDNLEIIISDNASSDATQEICEEYLRHDQRIKYIRQPDNQGAANNFVYVLIESRGKYFTWAACDDLRTPDFILDQVNFLEENPGFAASTSPNCYIGEELDLNRRITFQLTGNPRQRFVAFLNNAWKSHGIFYSVIRTSLIRDCPFLRDSFIATDWVIDLYLASLGEIHRTKRGLIVFGKDGISSQKGGMLAFQKKKSEIFFPLEEFSQKTWGMTSTWNLEDRLCILWKLFELNVSVLFRQILSITYEFYCSHFRTRFKL